MMRFIDGTDGGSRVAMAREWRANEHGNYESADGQFRIEPLAQDGYRDSRQTKMRSQWELRVNKNGRWVKVADARTIEAAKYKAEQPQTWDTLP